jgi:hypothetical protein
MLSGQYRFSDLKVTRKAAHVQELMLPFSGKADSTHVHTIEETKTKYTMSQSYRLDMQTCTYISKSLSTSRGEIRLEANIRGGG